MEEIRKLAESFKSMAKAGVKVSTAWVTVKSVDWEGEKTMIATGLMDDLDYNDVLLGLGGTYLKPKVGKLCLIGLIENQDAATFLIEAEEVEEMEINAVKITFNGGLNKGLIKVDPLKAEMQKLNTNITILKNATKAVATAVNGVVPGTSVPFETAIATMQAQDLSGIENDKIKH